MKDLQYKPFGTLLSNIIDNRGKTCPTAETGTPLIATNCISNDNLYPSHIKVRYVDEDTLSSWFRGHPQPDDMIFVTKGTPGRVAWVPNPVGFCIAQDMVAIRPNREKIYPKYLFAALRSRRIQYEIEGLHVGTLIPHFKKGDFNELLIPIPTDKLQQYIGDLYFDLSLKIDLLHRQNKTLELIAETLFRQWFIEEADDEWEEEKLRKYISVKHGYAFKGKDITTERTQQVLVTPGNFKIGGGFKFGKMKYLEGNDYPDGYIFKPDDLIVTMTDLSKDGDTLGYSALIPKHDQNELLYLHNQRVGLVQFKENISKYFIYFLMRTDDYQWYILGTASGTSVAHTSPTSIGNYSFRFPPKEKIQRFDDIVNPIIEKQHKNQSQVQNLEKLRDTLLPKLMSGEVRVAYEQDN